MPAAARPHRCRGVCHRFMDLSVSRPISDEEGRSKSEGSRESGVRESEGSREPEDVRASKGAGEPEDVRASKGAGEPEWSPVAAGRGVDRVMDRILRSRGAAAPGAS